MFKDMAFEEALYYVRRGRTAARAGWGGKSIQRQGDTIMEQEPTGISWVWEPTSADLLTKDWCIL